MNNTDKQPQTEEKCIAGCKTYYGGEKKHHKDCPFYPDSLSEYYDKRYCFTPEELQVLKAKWMMEQWISVNDRLPETLETVWISNGKGWTTLGCRSDYHYGDEDKLVWCWAKTNGIIYEEDGKIISECEEDDLDVTHWMPLPQPPKK